MDRADGLVGPDGTARVGTPSVTGQILSTSSKGSGLANIPIEEEKDSPHVELAEQDTIKHRFHMGWNEALTRGLGLRRGIIRSDSGGNIYKLLSCSIQRRDATRGTVETVEECMNGDTPPDRFECVPVELGLNIIKHPRYIHAFLGNSLIPATLFTGDNTGGYGSATEMANQMVIRLLQDYMGNTSAPWRNAIVEMLAASVSRPAGAGATQPPVYDPSTKAYPDNAYVQGTDMAKAAAIEIVTKYWRGEEVPSVVGFQITWTEYFWIPFPLNPGGFIEDPITEGGLPDFLWDTTFPPSYANAGVSDIFFAMAGINPQSYSRNGQRGGDVIISWRRESDQIVRERTFFGVQHRWVGSPVGHWDSDLYTRENTPTTASKFRKIKLSSGSNSGP